MAKALVTGGCGYVGSHVVAILIENGWQVTVIDNDHNRIENLRNDPAFRQASFREMDINSLRAGDIELGPDDAVFHLAGVVGAKACSEDYSLARRSNVEGTKALARALLTKTPPRFVFVSSCSVYGDSGETQMREDGLIAPTDYYADTKVVGETFLQGFWPKDRLRILRFGTLLGLSSTMRTDLMANAMSKSFAENSMVHVAGGNRWRPFLHCRDAARLTIAAADWSSIDVNRAPNVVNVSTRDHHQTIKGIAETIRKLEPSTQIIESPCAGDRRDYRVDTSRLELLMPDFKPVSIESGIAEMIAYFRASHSTSGRMVA